ncbi:hypothetical protein PSTT_07318 [Puccinia striiformis]|uniref:Uncharacterized protein n=1 Tax=Puccinia striiformis TaxID=27350 RepID=A0A2S4VHF8_9BASI|nr:hypothetical protein PSTT_07318 [Puccinia striiformis]
MASIAGFLHPCLGQGSMGQPEGMVKSRQTVGGRRPRTQRKPSSCGPCEEVISLGGFTTLHYSPFVFEGGTRCPVGTLQQASESPPGSLSPSRRSAPCDSEANARREGRVWGQARRDRKEGLSLSRVLALCYVARLPVGVIVQLGHWYSVYTVSFILHQLYSQVLDDIGMRELETAFLVSSLRDKRTRGAMTFGATKEIDALEAKSHPLHQRKHFQDLLPGSSAQTKQRQRHPMIEADVNKAEFKPNRRKRSVFTSSRQRDPGK